jgi:predicted nucleic acid-binding protein
MRLARAASDLEVRGSRVFDLQIALTALQNGATELWTHDRDFVSVPGLTVHDPLA